MRLERESDSAPHVWEVEVQVAVGDAPLDTQPQFVQVTLWLGYDPFTNRAGPCLVLQPWQVWAQKSLHLEDSQGLPERPGGSVEVPARSRGPTPQPSLPRSYPQFSLS